ncbi:MAG: phosphoribulokinase [Arenicellales bacterium]
MSTKHPVIAITGSSGAGTSTVRTAFEHIFYRENVNACIIEGDSFHRYDREEMHQRIEIALAEGTNLSHFGPEANHFGKIAELFERYGESGTGMRRFYIHDEPQAAQLGGKAGTFTPWEPIPEGTDLLFYEGLHGAVVHENVNAAKHVDLLIGVVPIVNLEWIQKIHRDTNTRGYEHTHVRDNILRRMHDYVHHIVPQFSRTDINFQRVPTVDTSNPFIARDIPTPDESFVVIRFRDPDKFGIDFPFLLAMLQGSFMSRRNTIVVPGGKIGLAMETMFTPIIDRLIVRRRELLGEG